MYCSLQPYNSISSPVSGGVNYTRANFTINNNYWFNRRGSAKGVKIAMWLSWQYTAISLSLKYIFNTINYILIFPKMLNQGFNSLLFLVYVVSMLKTSVIPYSCKARQYIHSLDEDQIPIYQNSYYCQSCKIYSHLNRSIYHVISGKYTRRSSAVKIKGELYVWSVDNC